MADKFDEFLEEVEQDIRQERFQKIWNKHGKTIIAIVVAILALTAGLMVWNNHQYKQSIVFSEKLVGAQNLIAQNKIPEALGVLGSLSKESHTGYSVLAQFSRASIFAKDGPQQSIKTAKEIYESISKDHGTNKYLRDLATFFLVNLEIDQMTETPDEADIKKNLDRLDTLTDAENPWHTVAKELKGLLLYKQNKFTEASEIFITLVQDPKSPNELRMRAQLMSQVLSSQLSSQEAK